MSIEKVKLLGIKGNSRDLDRFLANVLLKVMFKLKMQKKYITKVGNLSILNMTIK